MIPSNFDANFDQRANPFDIKSFKQSDENLFPHWLEGK